MISHDAVRIAEVYRLHLAGLTESEIADQLSVDLFDHLVGASPEAIRATVAGDLASIDEWQRQYQDPEQVRMGIALDLDAVFKSIMSELRGTWLSRQSNAKALFYREARETLNQKAMLFGLNSANLNVNARGKMFNLIQELRRDATELEAEADHPALPEPGDFPITTTAVAGLLVTSDSGDGR